MSTMQDKKIRSSKFKIQYPTIGIDASRALVAQRTGTEYYSASLIEAFTCLPEAERYRFTLYVNSPSEAEARERLGFPLPPTWRVRAIPFPRLWTHARLSVEMVTRPPDVLFVPSHVVPLWHPRRTVVTIHDLGYIHYPQAHTTSARLYLHLSTRFSVRAARRVIAISEATRRDLITYYKVPSRKISVVYHGRDPIFAPVEDKERVAQVTTRYGVSQPYCIHVGTLQPRKNLMVLVEAWDQLRGKVERPPQLLLAGRRGWLYDSLLEAVEARNLGDLIKFTDYVEREDLPALYSGAMALTFPSLYEGFGLPALEAMSCGTPVLASDTSSLPEVVGDAGLLLDPHDPGAWAGVVQRLMRGKALQRDLSRKGLERAASFTWERCARQTLAVLAAGL
ncbi:MAG TPA: glycosyltransferase family 1 protein [Chloroflexia bacterium]|jgi:glycosyltransferase involved in cell wall biosynthesis